MIKKDLLKALESIGDDEVIACEDGQGYIVSIAGVKRDPYLPLNYALIVLNEGMPEGLKIA